MAESIIIHCRESDRAEFVRRIANQFTRVSESMWRFPADDYLVSVTPYSDFESEYDHDEKVDVITRLGESSVASFDFEIRRSRSDDACDLIEAFVRHNCLGLELVVDDMFRIMSRVDLSEVHDFLDVYRYKKQEAEQVSGGNGGQAR